MALQIYAVNVTTAAQIQLYPGAAGVAVGGRRINVFNNGPNAIYLGPTGVTAATGFRVPTATAKDLMVGGDVNTAIFAIVDTADQVSPANTRVMIETGT